MAAGRGGRPDHAAEEPHSTVSTGRRSPVLPVAALAAGLIVAGIAGAAGETAPAEADPMAVAARVERSGQGTTLSIDLSRAVEAEASVLESPDRVVIDLPQVNFQIDPSLGRIAAGTGGLVKSFRFGAFAPGHARVIIDLAGPASVARLGTTPIAVGEPARLAIELARTDRASFHKAAMAAAAMVPSPAPPAALAAPSPAPSPSRRVIVIDPGHGGVDPGASGVGGIVEKTITFDFATALADKLDATGRYTVVLTRRGDSFVSLADRVKVARDAGAALFVSIHADTLSAGSGVTGATVYTCSDRASDAEAARVAATENQADARAGVEAAPDAPGVNDILFDLTRRETRTYAHLFQRTLVGYWQKIAHLNKNPERAAGFKVLQAPDVPSVLLELGYLSSEKDAKALTSPDWRAQASGSVVAAVDAFFAPRQVSVEPTATVAAAPMTPRSN